MLIWKKSGSNTNYNSTVWSAIKSGTPVHVSMNFSQSNITLDDSDISLDGALTLMDIFNGDIDLVFGKAISRQVNVRILNSSKLNNLDWTEEFGLYFKITIGTVEYTAFAGYYTGSKPKNVSTAKYIDFTAYDNMKKFDVLADGFASGLTYPKTVDQLFSALCTYVGVTAGSTSDALTNIKSRSFASAPFDMASYTCRDILALIAEACGCYAVMNGNACDLVWFKNNTGHSIAQTEEFRINTGDLDPGVSAYAVDKVLVKQFGDGNDVYYPSATGSNVYIITGNPFLNVASSSDTTNYIKPIYDRLAALGGYLPIELECVGDPAVQAGDIITVNVNGTNYSIPIFVKTMNWNGMCTDSIETTGQIPRATYNSESGKEQKLIRMYVYDHYYGKQSGIEIVPDGIELNASRYVKMLSGSSVKIKSGATFEVDSNNFGIDSSGNAFFAGELRAATGTFSGTLSASCITSGTLDSDRIDAADFFSKQATINALNATDISSNTYLQLMVNAKNKTYRQWTTPSDPHEGDTWYKQAPQPISEMQNYTMAQLASYPMWAFDGFELYRYESNEWRLIDDPAEIRSTIAQILMQNDSISIQVAQIDNDLDNKYTMRSGIDIVYAGIEVSGSKYVRIKTGGKFTADSGNFSIDEDGNVVMAGKITSSEGQIGGFFIGATRLSAGSGANSVGIDSGTANFGYFLWAGADNAASAPFSVSKQGELVATSVKTAAEAGGSTTVDLSAYPLWKLDYSTIKQATIATDSGGYCTGFTLSNGTTVNFRRAADVTLTSVAEYGSPAGNRADLTVTVVLTNGRSVNASCDASNYFANVCAYARTGYTKGTFTRSSWSGVQVRPVGSTQNVTLPTLYEKA